MSSSLDWNSSRQPATKRLLPEVVNPVFGPARAPDSPDGYPVTHYVGVAGVGEDAARLPAGDARAGMFGYGRQTRQQDLLRGGANTIAVLGVQGRCGPWAEGGTATVRPLTQRPYVNGPDGFGSGQAHGMVAGMADGSARFLSDKIAPELLDQLAAVRGGEQVDAASLDPQPPPADEKPLAALEPKRPAPADVKTPSAAAKPPEPVDPKLQAALDLPLAGLKLPNMRLG